MKKFLLYFVFLVTFSSLFLFRFQAISHRDFIPENGELVGVILEEPEIVGNTQRFSVSGVSVITGRYPEYRYGDEVKLQIPISKSQKNPKSKVPSIYYPKIELVDKEKGSGMLGKIYEFRRRVVAIYQKVLPEPEASLLTGIVLGVKSNLPRDFYEALRVTGTMHVVVASGTNITIFVGFIFLLLSAFLHRRLSIFLSFFGILFYVALAGFAAPIIRAGLMAFIAFSAQLLGRQRFGIVSLVFTALLMLFWNPLYLFDVGFQLSVSATAGLLVIQPILKRLKGIFSLPFIGGDLSTTIAAQLGVLPILFLSFGTISLLSPAINALILWTVPVVMIFGFLIAFLGFVFLPLAQIVSYFAYALLFYFVEVVRLFGEWGMGLVTIEKPSIFLAIGYYCILVSVILFITMRRRSS